MTPWTTTGLARCAITGLSAAGLAVAALSLPAVAGAAPDCPNEAAGSPTQCCVKVGDAPGPGPTCTSKQSVGRGALGDAPVVGNLPGLGGIL